MNISLSEVQRLTGGQLIKPQEQNTFDHIEFDSRRMVFPEKTLFLALRGNRRDGHQFLADAYQSGVRNFIISQKIDVKAFPNASFLLVRDVLEHVQSWSKIHRANFDHPVIGITGSNGKTIVKEWLSEILAVRFSPCKSPKSYNSQLGVPISILMLRKFHDMGIIEAGISRPGEMQTLAEMIRCNLGILTNIGDAHDAGFLDKGQKIREKILLFQNADRLIYRLDDIFTHRYIEQVQPALSLISWSLQGNKSAKYLLSVRINLQKTEICVRENDRKYTFVCQFQNQASLENIGHCIIAALELGIPPAQIQDKLVRLLPIPLRSELIHGSDNNIILNDSYSFDIFSLSSALDLLTVHAGNRERILILSDMRDQNIDESYKAISQLIKKYSVAQVVGLGSDIANLKASLGSQTDFRHFPDKPTLITYLKNQKFSDKAILVKGARAFNMEEICAQLLDQKHKTSLEINLSALDHNISEYSKYLCEGTSIMAVIKASGYGSGSDRLARKLENLGIEYLAVAYIDEGVYLRKSGIVLPILVLNPDPAEKESLIEYNLEPEIYCLEQLEKFLSDNALLQNLPGIHIKLDTGMHRLGFSSRDLPVILERIKSFDLRIKSIFTHLSASENPAKDEETTGQLELFASMYEQIVLALGYRPMRHVLNSSGVIRFGKHQFEMVRLGIGMFGLDPTGTIQHRLKKVHRLSSWVSQIKTVDPGQSIGYGRNFITNSRKTIATLGIGYADGLMRALGNGKARFYLNGVYCPTIGNVCMDMTMIEIPDPEAFLTGAEVEIFGEMVDIWDLAEIANTIPYEILCNISNRVKRIYTEV